MENVHWFAATTCFDVISWKNAFSILTGHLFEQLSHFYSFLNKKIGKNQFEDFCDYFSRDLVYPECFPCTNSLQKYR